MREALPDAGPDVLAQPLHPISVGVVPPVADGHEVRALLKGLWLTACL